MSYVLTMKLRNGAKSCFTVDDFQVTSGYVIFVSGSNYKMIPLDTIAVMEWNDDDLPEIGHDPSNTLRRL